MHGRIPHQIQLAEDVDPSNGEHRDLTLMRRAIETMGIDVQIALPQPMLEIGLHPPAEIEDAADLCLQPLVHQPHPGARAAHQVDAGAAIRQPGGVPRDDRRVRRQARRDRLPRHRAAAGRRLRAKTCRSIAPSRSAASPGRPCRRAGLQHRPAAQPVRVGASRRS